MNNVSFLGRIATDIDMRINGEMQIASFSLAVNRRGKDKGADFFRCKAFGKTADVIEKYFHKGSRICVRAVAFQPPKYTNKEGTTVYPNVEFNIQELDFVDTKAESESNDYPQPLPADKKPDDDFLNITDDQVGELPFR